MKSAHGIAHEFRGLVSVEGDVKRKLDAEAVHNLVEGSVGQHRMTQEVTQMRQRGLRKEIAARVSVGGLF